MKLSFRQGIVRYEQLQAPPFISKTPLSGSSTVDLTVIDEPIVVTFAHGAANYIIEEKRSITGAWGSADPNSTNGPLAQNQTQYLYWDLNLTTGALTRGWTDIAWIKSATEPMNPPNGLHWFDLSSSKMKVWRQKPGSIGFWQDVVRCFAGIYQNNATLVPYPIGSQVGINGSFDGGNIILGANNAPLRQSDGTFATTSTQLIIQQTSGQNVKFDAALIFANAVEEIPAFYLVTFGPNNTIQLARNSDYYRYAHGLVVEDLSDGENGRVVTSGLIENDTWDFPEERVGSPLFLGPSGQLMFAPPPGGICQRVGDVYSKTAINLNFHQPVRIR
jgi:hypothetical protein